MLDIFREDRLVGGGSVSFGSKDKINGGKKVKSDVDEAEEKMSKEQIIKWLELLELILSKNKDKQNLIKTVEGDVKIFEESGVPMECVQVKLDELLGEINFEQRYNVITKKWEPWEQK